MKGTRNEPQCGFSYKVLSMLNENGAQFEVVNVLDEIYNPGLREAIKNYSQWPTIPQVEPAEHSVSRYHFPVLQRPSNSSQRWSLQYV